MGNCNQTVVADTARVLKIQLCVIVTVRFSYLQAFVERENESGETQSSFFFPALGSSLILFTSIKEPDMTELKSDLLAAKEEIAAFQTEKKESVRLNP